MKETGEGNMSWGNPETTPERLLTTLLLPASALYAVGSYIRLKAYGAGRLKRHDAKVPVISVGNLTCGGTGKTPVTIDLAQRLVSAGYNVAIVSRGYQRKSGEQLLVVSDGAGHIATCLESGDEPYMMAQAVPQAKVIVSAKRWIAAEVAAAVYDANVIILDDGFQHLAIKRDQDVVLIDYNDDPAADSLLPAGRLREPISALIRASWVVITRVPSNPNPARLSYLEELLRDKAERAEITRCRFVPSSLRPYASNDVVLSPSSLSGVKVVALSGLARPRAFHAMLAELQANVVKKRAFPDHHWWSPSDMESLKRDLSETGAELIVTTSKDAVRLNPDLCHQLPVSVLELKTEWLGPVPVVSVPLYAAAAGDQITVEPHGVPRP